MVRSGKLNVGISPTAESGTPEPRENLPAVTAAHLCEVVRGLFLKAFKQRSDRELLRLQQKGFHTGWSGDLRTLALSL